MEKEQEKLKEDNQGIAETIKNNSERLQKSSTKIKEVDEIKEEKKKEIVPLDEKIQKLKKELLVVEKELTEKKFAILALVKREERLYSLEQRVKDLYKKAGIEINFD